MSMLNLLASVEAHLVSRVVAGATAAEESLLADVRMAIAHAENRAARVMTADLEQLSLWTQKGLQEAGQAITLLDVSNVLHVAFRGCLGPFTMSADRVHVSFGNGNTLVCQHAKEPQ